MADERTTMQQPQSEAKVARNTHGREMSALSYAAIYRQKLKEEQVRRISESKMHAEDEAEAKAKAQEKEQRRLAMEERMQKEREAIAARNAVADAVLTDVAERAAVKAAAAQAEVSEPVVQTVTEPVKTVSRPTPAAPVFRPAPAPKAEASARKTPAPCVIEIGGGELQAVVQPDGTEVYVVKAEAEEHADGVIIVDDVLNEYVYGDETDADVVYLSEDGEPLAAEDTAATVAEEDAEPAPMPQDEAQPSVEEAVCGGEPKAEQTDGESEATTPRKLTRAEKREKKRAARNIKEIREQEEARLAEEAVRSALENNGEMTPARAKQEENVRRLMARNEAVHATAQVLDAEEKARLDEELAEAEAAEEALIRKNNEKREAQRAAFENARAAARAAEEAKLSEAAARTEEQNRKNAEAREATEASFAALAERVREAEEQAEAARAEREGADAAKQARVAAAKAERDSERDRERLERAEDEALRDRDIKDWQKPYTGSDATEEDKTDETAPLRAAARRASYSRQERRSKAAEAEQNRIERIKAEVALWNESETEESLYAVLPEDVETMTRRELRRLFREQIRSLEKSNRFCAKALLLSKRKIESPLAVRTGFEAIAAERRMIETMTRAIRIARIGKIRGHIRPLSRRIAKEIRRERKLLKYQTKIAGYAPVPCDPKMPKSVRKNIPFKLPTTLYRTEEDA